MFFNRKNHNQAVNMKAVLVRKLDLLIDKSYKSNIGYSERKRLENLRLRFINNSFSEELNKKLVNKINSICEIQYLSDELLNLSLDQLDNIMNGVEIGEKEKIYIDGEIEIEKIFKELDEFDVTIEKINKLQEIAIKERKKSEWFSLDRKKKRILEKIKNRRSLLSTLSSRNDNLVRVNELMENQQLYNKHKLNQNIIDTDEVENIVNERNYTNQMIMEESNDLDAILGKLDINDDDSFDKAYEEYLMQDEKDEFEKLRKELLEDNKL